MRRGNLLEIRKFRADLLQLALANDKTRSACWAGLAGVIAHICNFVIANGASGAFERKRQSHYPNEKPDDTRKEYDSENDSHNKFLTLWIFYHLDLVFWMLAGFKHQVFQLIRAEPINQRLLPPALNRLFFFAVPWLPFDHDTATVYALHSALVAREHSAKIGQYHNLLARGALVFIYPF